MELLNECKTETIYELKFTERELGSILVALGMVSYGNLQKSAKRDYTKVNILSSDKQHNLYSDLLDLLDIAPIC